MDLDYTIFNGTMNRPVIVFIHGLGVDRNIWVNPMGTKMFAGNVPLRIFASRPPKGFSEGCNNKFNIGTIPDTISNLWDVLKNREFNLICWSQSRPVGPINIAVKELDQIMSMARIKFPHRSVVLIGHSRGGLVARKFMEKQHPEVKALITIATPHAGSSLALLGKYLKPVMEVLKFMLPVKSHSAIIDILKRLNDLIQGRAAEELLKDSEFFRTLHDAPADGVRYLSFGGTRTRLFTLYKCERRADRTRPEPFLMVPDSIFRMLPDAILPDELISGKGDILVTAKSSVLPWAAEHFNVPANHVSVLWHRKTIKIVSEFLEELV